MSTTPPLSLNPTNSPQSIAASMATPIPIVEIPTIFPQQVKSPPSGLIYRQEGKWWMVNADGNPKLLAEFDGNLSLNPSGTRAIHNDWSEEARIRPEEVILLDFQEGKSDSLSLESPICSDPVNTVWLDDRTAVISVANKGETVTQNTVCHLALLDVVSRQVTIMEQQTSVYTQPSVTTSGKIVLNTDGEILLWQKEQTRPLNLSGIDIAENGEMWSAPVFSPDEKMLAGIITGNFGPHPFAYFVIDLDKQTREIVHTFRPVPTNAVLPLGIHWSPSSRWLALRPENFPYTDADTGVWLISMDSGKKIFLGTGTSNPVWIDDKQIVFSAVCNGTTRLQSYDLASGERYWLDLPTHVKAIIYTGTVK